MDGGGGVGTSAAPSLQKRAILAPMAPQARAGRSDAGVLPRRRLRTLALGVRLAWRGALAIAGMCMAALGALVSVAVAAVLARRGGHGAASLPAVASSAIAWSAGVSLAFGVALRAIRRDHGDGVVALMRARGASLGEYVRARTAGLVVVLAVVIGGATLVAGLAAVSAAAAASETERAALAALAALVYALAFSGVVGPVALAALGARTRAGGYLTLLAVLVLPELVSRWTRALLPDGWGELTSIPAALGALRAGILSPYEGAASAARALAGLLAVAGVALAVVRARAGAASHDTAGEGQRP